MAMTEQRENSLRRPFETVVTEESTARPDAVYETLADLQTHRIWGAGKNGLQSLTAPAGPAVAGTEFESTGNDQMGPFDDHSVVITARPGELFEFVTEAHQTPKKGGLVVWTVVHRYTIAPREGGSTVTYTNRVDRISRTKGMLRLFNSRLLSGLTHKMTASIARAGVRNLIAHVEKN